MGTAVQTGTIRTAIPARLDRLPWSRFHWLVVVGLGTVWILDGLEVTIVGAIASRLTEHGSGIAISTSQIGTAGALYVTGACVGALFFGQLTDRFGRKKLFMITLGVYITATAATAFAFAPWYFFLCRFFTGAGIGGEYAAINSAIDELIPARVRGRVDLAINGSFWVGSIIASAVSILFLSTAIFATDLGWRLEFGVGVVLAFGILLVRRHVPESPRWLFIHGREEEAERIVDGIEHDIEKTTSRPLETPRKTIEVRQRKAISFREIGRVAFGAYPKRAVLGFCLFVGQAFIYNGITFNLGSLFTTFFGVAAATVPVFLIIYAIGNFLGPLTLGRLFDTVGRKPMIAGDLLGLRAGHGADGDSVRKRRDRPMGIRGVRVRRLLPRLGGRQRGLSDGVGGLSDGDAGAGDRVLLRDRDGRRGDQWAAAVQQSDRQRPTRTGRAGVLHRGGSDGGRRYRRDLPGRARGGGAARGHRQATERRGRRGRWGGQRQATRGVPGGRSTRPARGAAGTP